MEATEGEKQRPTSRRAVRTIAALTVVGLLIVVPGAGVLLSALQGGSHSVGDSPSGLSTAGDKSIKFIETGLATGTSWSVDLEGTVMSSTGTEISFSEIPGTYTFTIPTVTGYTASPSAGSVTLKSCGATVDITFTPVKVSTYYTVWFNETGLAAGTTWWANLSGDNVSSDTPSISFSVVNDTYTFTTPDNVSGSPGVQFYTPVSNGTVVVNGANQTVMVPYSVEYFLTMIASPPAGGTVSPASGWYSAGAIVPIVAASASGYVFIEWNGTGVGNYTGTSTEALVTMDSPIVENATFGASFEVQFEETGLPAGTSWSVTLNGATESAISAPIDFSAVNDTYGYTVAPISGYHAGLYASTVTVAGSDVTVTVQWTPVTYDVTFEEVGLPSASSWQVTLDKTELGSSTSSILFTKVANGSYTWSGAPISGYTANVTSGTVVVHGANVVVHIGWTAVTQVAQTYSISFVEAGLVASTAWTVTLNGSGSSSLGSSTNTITFTGLANGSYVYWVPDVGSFLPATSTTTVHVSGANVTVDVSFTALQPAVHPPTTKTVSLWDVLLIAFIAGAGVAVTWAIFRRK
jgi:Divergent InlB B-repeat domain